MEPGHTKLRGEDEEGLRILSLDGGGVRGLSELYILQLLMRLIDKEHPPRPCDIFDLICGSSTGGLLAIMLGRLRMDVDACIVAYQEVSASIWNKRPFIPITSTGRLKARYSHESLIVSAKKIIRSQGLDEEELLQEYPEPSLPVTVVVARRVPDSKVQLLSSSSILSSGLGHVKIWEAARATSAAPGIFDPPVIGPYGTQYVDGGMGANNPVQYAMLATKQIWPNRAVRCLVSVGSGHAQIKSVPTKVVDLARYLVSLTTDTENIAEMFAQQHRHMIVKDEYYRFNVHHGIENIHLDDWRDSDRIVSSTLHYCFEAENQSQFERCAERLMRRPRPQQEVPRVETPTISIGTGLESVPTGVPSNSQGKSELLEGPVNADAGSSQKIETDDLNIHANPISEHLLDFLSRFFAEDVEVKALLVSGKNKIGSGRLEKNFSVLLEDFAERLALEDGMHEVSQFIGSRSLNIVHRVSMRLPADVIERSTDPLPSYEDVLAARDEVQDLGETQRKFQDLDEMQLSKSSLQSTKIASQGLAALAELRHDLRRFVFPSTKSYIREVLLPSLPSTVLAPIYSVAVRVNWELQTYLAEEFDAEDDISSILTITGGMSRAQALSCEDYMHQTWPQSGSDTLLAVKYALQTGASYYQYSASHSARLQFTDPGEPAQLSTGTHLSAPLLVQIDGKPHDIIESIEQFAWLATSFRSSQGNSVCLSQVEFRVVSTSPEAEYVMTDLILCPMRRIHEEELGLGSCWTILYPSAVVACGFPIAPRDEPAGLEIPLQLMLSFSGAKFPIEFQDSIIIRQDPIIIFPIAKTVFGTQWHVVSGGLSEFFKEIKLSPLLPIQDDMRLTLNGRHFVGWLKNAQVNLGTQRPTDQSSGASLDNDRGLQLGEEFSATLNIRLPWIVSLTGGAKIRAPRSQRQKIEARQLDYQVEIRRSSRTQAMYYDCGSKTGWLVPELSLLLHIAYAALLEHCRDLDALYHLYYARRLADGGDAALRAIQECGDIILWTTEEDDKKKDIRFKDFIKDFVELFDNRKKAMDTRLEHRELKANLDLRGWDFGDLRDFTAFYGIRKVAAPKVWGRPDWWDLAKEPNTLVVLGNNAGQVICPNGELQRPCRSWASLPADYDLFASTISCLKDVCRPHENRLPQWRLSTRLAWHQPKDSRPFDDCAGNSCNPVQKLRDLRFLKRSHGLRNPTDITPSGAVVFGLPKMTSKHVRVLQRSQGQCAPLQQLGQSPSSRVYLRTRTPLEHLWSNALGVLKMFLSSLKSHILWYLVPAVLGVSAIAIKMGMTF